MEKLYKAGDATATTGLVIGIVPGLAAFFVAGGAKQRGDWALFEQAGDTGVWFGGLGMLLLLIGGAMMWAGNRTSKQ